MTDPPTQRRLVRGTAQQPSTGLIRDLRGYVDDRLIIDEDGEIAMGPETSNVLFLVIGAVLIVGDGQLLRRSGATYLEEAYPDPKVADSVNRLIAVLFHLVMLGVLALMSVRATGGYAAMIFQLGIMLLIMALGHGLTIWVLARLRRRNAADRVREAAAIRSEENGEN